ncbi:MAG TPA: SurA N-terminal domain-containing protein, partial [Candidatus Deferrimicrobium sp.]|nr:SurA N-terminal domain-containing protein [Candidatus Deferrimicrobium sp.]
MRPLWASAALAALLFTAADAIFAQRQPVDQIVAVVGDRVILASELSSQMQLATLQTGQRPETETQQREFRDEMLQQMISDQLILVAARQ